MPRRLGRVKLVRMRPTRSCMFKMRGNVRATGFQFTELRCSMGSSKTVFCCLYSSSFLIASCRYSRMAFAYVCNKPPAW